MIGPGMTASGYHGAPRKSIKREWDAALNLFPDPRAKRCGLPAKYQRCIGARPHSGYVREPWMSIDLSAVRRIAHLARIEVTEAETPHLQNEINAILKFVEALDAVDVAGVEPMTSVIPMRLPMREDVVTDGGIAPLVLANAPMTEDGFFVVPKVIE
jgi:aspartyl-tRNA(Asn)/glutamyl-tRNA(Gln) amidotransferase subunit C